MTKNKLVSLFCAAAIAAGVPCTDVFTAEALTRSSVPAGILSNDANDDGTFLKQRADNDYLEGWNADKAGSYHGSEDYAGTLTAEWAGIHDCMTLIGKRYDEPIDMPDQCDMSYQTEIQAEGVCYFGAYVYLNNPDRALYILDGWSGWDPFSGSTPVKTVEIGGVQYDLYVQADPGDLQPTNRYTFWNIRRENTWNEGEKAVYQGTVPVAEHLHAWEGTGYLPDNGYLLYQVSAAVMAWGTGNENQYAAGSCKIAKPVFEIRTEQEQPSVLPSGIPPLQPLATDDTRVQTDSDGSFRIGWNQSSSGTFDYQAGTEKEITGSWENTVNSLFWNGIQFPDPKPADQMGTIRVDYDAEMKAAGNSWYGVRGYTDGDVPIEFFVLEGWTGSKETDRLTPEKTVEIGGVRYDLYKTFRQVSAGTERNEGFMQYWSVRQENAFTNPEGTVCKDTVLLSDHIRAWNGIGAQFGQCNLTSVFFTAENSCYGYDSSGQLVQTEPSGSCTIRQPVLTVQAETEPPTVTAGRDYEFLEHQEDGTYLEGWNEGKIGSYSCKKQPDGSLKAAWSDVHNCITHNGKYFEERIPMPESCEVTYELEAEASGICYLGLSVWVDNPQRELYVLDGWNGFDPRRGKEPLATLESNGVKYDLYIFYQQYSGSQIRPVFWSIRQENLFREGEKTTISATVSLDQHFRMWEKLGRLDWESSRLAYINVWAEGFGSGTNNASGSCTVKKPEVVITNAPADTVPVALTGDANCDNVVDIADAVLVMRYAVADSEAVITEQGIKNADTDKNGRTDDRDATMILQFIAKKITF